VVDNGNVYVADTGNNRVVVWGPGATEGVVVAGTGVPGSLSNQLSAPSDVAVDSTGAVLVADSNNNRVMSFAPGLQIGEVVAGHGGGGEMLDQLRSPRGIALDSTGTLYISDTGNDRVVKYESRATVGAFVVGAIFDGGGLGNGPGSALNQLEGPTSLAVDSSGAVFVSDSQNHRVLKFPAGETVGILVVGGNGRGSADAQLDTPRGVALDSDGSVVIADTGNHRIIKREDQVSPSGTTDLGGERGGQGSATDQFDAPMDVHVDAGGSTYILDRENHRVLRFAPGAGSGTIVAGGNGGGPSLLQLFEPLGFAVDTTGAVLVADTGNNRVVKWAPGATLGILVGGIGAGEDVLLRPADVDVDAAGNFFVANSGYGRVLRYSPTQGCAVFADALTTPTGLALDGSSIVIADAGRNLVLRWAMDATAGTIIGGGQGSGGGLSQFDGSLKVAVDRHKFVYVSDSGNHRVLRLDPMGSPTVVAGGSGRGSAAAQLDTPGGIAFSREGHIVVADTNNHRVMQKENVVDEGAGATTGFGGSGAGSNVDQFRDPVDIFIAADRTSYVLDGGNSRVLMFPPGAESGIVVAGGKGEGDALTQLRDPLGLTVDGTGRVYIADTGNHRVVAWAKDATEGVVVAGIGGKGAAANQLKRPADVGLNVRGELFVSDGGNDRVMRYAPQASLGTEVSGALNPALSEPRGLIVTENGELVIADSAMHRVVQLEDADGDGTFESTQVLAGGASEGSTLGQLAFPTGVAVDRTGALFVADRGNHRVVKVGPGSLPEIAAGGVRGSSANELDSPLSVAVTDTALHIVDTGNHRVIIVDNAVAPVGEFLFGQNGTVGNNPFDNPTDVVILPDGTTFVLDKDNNRVIKYAPGDTAGVAGEVVAGGNGAGGGLHQLSAPEGLAVDGSGNVYVADTGNDRVVRWAPGATQGEIIGGYPGADQLSGPSDVVVGEDGTVYVVDTGNHRVVSYPAGVVNATGTVVAGECTSDYNCLDSPRGIAVDGDGALYIADTGNERIVRCEPGGVCAVAAGGNGAGTARGQLNGPVGVSVDGQGTVYVVDHGNDRVVKWPPGANAGEVIAGGNGNGNGAGQLSGPTGVALDPNGGLVIADAGNDRIVRWNDVGPSGEVVGGGQGAGPTLDQLNSPTDVWAHGGYTYVCDTVNNRVVKFAPGALRGEVVGDSTTDVSSPLLASPTGIVVDRSGNIYVADSMNHRIVQFAPGNPVGSVRAGAAVAGAGSCCSFDTPQDVAIDSAGNLFIVDTQNHRVVKWAMGQTSGEVIVGDSASGGSPAGAELTRLDAPTSAYVDRANNLFIADAGNGRVVKWSPGATEGQVVATAPAGTLFYGVYVDCDSAVFVSDRAAHAVQRFVDGISVVVAGGVSPGAGTSALSTPLGIHADENGVLSIADSANHRVVAWEGAAVGGCIPDSNDVDDFIEKYDTDGDGGLSKAELLKAIIDKALEECDTSGDGALSATELVACKNDVLLKLFDTDGDGQLDPDEIEALLGSYDTGANAIFAGRPFNVSLPGTEAGNDLRLVGPVAEDYRCDSGGSSVNSAQARTFSISVTAAGALRVDATVMKAGSYALCWCSGVFACSADSDFRATAAILMVNGPIRGAALECTLGVSCVVNVELTSLPAFDEGVLVAVGEQCGGNSTVFPSTEAKATSVMFFGGPVHASAGETSLLTGPPRVFVLEVPLGVPRFPNGTAPTLGEHLICYGAEDVWYNVPLAEPFVLNGPEPADVVCTLGEPCAVVLRGRSLAATNRIKVTLGPTCIAPAVSGWGGVETLTAEWRSLGPGLMHCTGRGSFLSGATLPLAACRAECARTAGCNGVDHNSQTNQCILRASALFCTSPIPRACTWDYGPLAPQWSLSYLQCGVADEKRFELGTAVSGSPTAAAELCWGHDSRGSRSSSAASPSQGRSNVRACTRVPWARRAASRSTLLRCRPGRA
jgi:sugar lactone lactonase YvrE